MVFIAVGCFQIACGESVQTRPSPAPVSSATPIARVPKVAKQTILANLEINPELGEDFGWLSNGEVFYGQRNGNEINWFVYNPIDRAYRPFDGPYPNLDPQLSATVSLNNAAGLTALTVSPTGKSILYTQVPTDYLRGRPAGPDYFDPQQLWMSYAGSRPVLITERFSSDCGILSPSSDWLVDETMLLGTCLPYYGTDSYFTMNLQTREIRYYDQIEMDAGNIDNLSIAVMAHRNPVLAFSTYGHDGLWVTPLDHQNGRGPIQAAGALMVDDENVIAPEWSRDDQWIYYWRQGANSKSDQATGSAYFPWWLERMNMATRRSDIVLGAEELRALLGDAAYDAQYSGYRWRLAAGERQLLLLRNTMLFMISW
jgi:hypothetical protein